MHVSSRHRAGALAPTAAPAETAIARPAENAAFCVAVTGASGFIGSAVVAALGNQGWRVKALTRRRDCARMLEQRGVNVVIGSLAESPALAELLAGVDAVVHCAGVVRGANYADFAEVNVAGTRNLLSAMGRAPIALLALSSLAAREPQLSDYAQSKRAMEAALGEANAAGPCLILRPPAVYGPGDRELKPVFDAFARGFAPLPAARNARVSLLYVDDLAAAVVAWLGASGRAGGVYEIGDGQADGYSWDEVVATAETLLQRRIRRLPLPTGALNGVARANRRAARWLGYAPMLTPGKLRELRHADWVCDNTSLQSVLDWTPRVSLVCGMQRTYGRAHAAANRA